MTGAGWTDRRLGQSDLAVAPLALGTMTFGASSTYMRGVTADDHEALAILDCALSEGVTLIDTANSYSQGLTETLLGQWLGPRRKSVVLATKVGMVISETGTPGPPIPQGLHPDLVRRSCEASLKRLATDWIDLFHLHMQDTSVPIADTLGVCHDLIREGKIRHIGLSNYTGVRLMEAVHASRADGLASIATVQAQWSLAVRDAEREMVPAAQLAGASLLAWSPLARGFLSGAVDPEGTPRRGSRLDAWRPSLQTTATPRNLALLATVKSLANAHSKPVSAVALAWLLARPELGAVILGARTLAQFVDNLEARNLHLSRDELLLLDATSAPEWGYPYSFVAALTGGSWR